MDPSEDQVTVLGAGAIGCGIASALAGADSRPLLVSDWPDHVSVLRHEGLVVVGNGGTSQRFAVDAQTTAELRAGPAQSLVYLAVKCGGTEAAAQLLDGVLAPGGTVVSMQNGFTLDRLCYLLGPERVIGGSPNFSAERSAPGVVTVTGAATELVVGEIDGRRSQRIDALAALTRAPGWTTTVSENVVGVLWAKLIANSVVNTLSVVGGWTVGQLMEDDTGRAVALAMLVEAAAVAGAAGLRLAPMPTLDVPQLLAEAASGLAAAAERLQAFGRLFAESRVSSLQDVLAGRPTELPYLTGRLIELGSIHGVATPISSVVFDLALRVEAGEAKPGEGKNQLERVR